MAQAQLRKSTYLRTDQGWSRKTTPERCLRGKAKKTEVEELLLSSGAGFEAKMEIYRDAVMECCTSMQNQITGFVSCED